MCYVAAIPYVAAAVGAGMSYYGQQQQASEYKRAQREQDAYAAAQRQLALNQKGEEEKFSEQKNKSIMQEAEVVAPSRVQQVQQAEDTQTASNVFQHAAARRRLKPPRKPLPLKASTALNRQSHRKRRKASIAQPFPAIHALLSS